MCAHNSGHCYGNIGHTTESEVAVTQHQTPGSTSREEAVADQFLPCASQRLQLCEQ